LSMHTRWVVIPCFNEAARLNNAALLELLAEQNLGIVLVDDGSDDGTRELIFKIQQVNSDVEVLVLQHNVGKAEAVRRGMNHALTLGAEVIGYLDADFATPPCDMLVLFRQLDLRDVSVCLGSRWLHLGARIDRSSFRHYGGRLFATAASAVLKINVYDTQCGAKVFRVSENLVRALSEPFLSRWAFDVELIGRLLNDPNAGYSEQDFIEVPLQQWNDIKGSKIGFLDMVTATFELLLIKRALNVWARVGAKFQ
jgi:dolichyl-phosphate beta-glucosyltransferase